MWALPLTKNRNKNREKDIILNTLRWLFAKENVPISSPDDHGSEGGMWGYGVNNLFQSVLALQRKKFYLWSWNFLIYLLLLDLINVCCTIIVFAQDNLPIWNKWTKDGPKTHEKTTIVYSCWMPLGYYNIFVSGSSSNHSC